MAYSVNFYLQNGKLLQSYIGDKNQGGIFEVSWNYRGDKVAASASDGTVRFS